MVSILIYLSWLLKLVNDTISNLISFYFISNNFFFYFSFQEYNLAKLNLVKVLNISDTIFHTK